MRQSILLVAVSLLAAPKASPADPKHKQPMSRNERGKFTAFAYSSGNKTAEGVPPVPRLTIAADPDVLPIGSRVRVSGAGPWSGEYRVGDTGGKIKGHVVDIYVPSDKEAFAFGKRVVELVLLQPPPLRLASRGSSPRKTAATQTSRVRGVPEEGTRARTQTASTTANPASETARTASCYRCRTGGRDIIAVDESRGTEPAGDVAPGDAGSSAGANDPR
jgi:3D (Asp-Asp-Asp) domain-containing protein